MDLKILFKQPSVEGYHICPLRDEIAIEITAWGEEKKREEEPAARIITAGGIQNIPAQTFTGNDIKPAATVGDGDVTLTPDVDYNVATGYRHGQL